ncbi:MAG: hypothetical protein WCB04_10020, partial [Mycobacteriales bacterium]
HHLRHDGPGDWRSVRVRNALVTDDRLEVRAPVGFDVVEISGTTARRDVDVELRRYDGAKVTTRRRAGQQVPAGRALRMAPTDWDRLSRGKVEQVVT